MCVKTLWDSCCAHVYVTRYLTRFPRWQFIIALSFSVSFLSLSFSLSPLVLYFGSLSSAVTLQSKCKWTGPKNTCPLTMVCNVSFCQLPDPAYFSGSSFLFPLLSPWAGCANMTPASLLKVTSVTSDVPLLWSMAVLKNISMSNFCQFCKSCL